MDNYFNILNAIDCNGKTEKKNGLTYLSWSWAWGEVKKVHPDATYTIYENADGWNYHTDGRTCWVKTGMTVNGIEHIEYLPVMDFRNASIQADKVTSFDVNKAIQRSLTKAAARHGLGLYIYAGEDLPEGAEPPAKPAPVVAINRTENSNIKVTRMTQIANDVMKYAKTKDKARIRAEIEEAEAWMKAQKRYTGLPYESLTPMEFADYLKALYEFYNPTNEMVEAVL